MDTELTPIAKEGPEWTQVAGAEFGETEARNSPTPYELDLLTVSFANEFNGLAAGAVCREAPPPDLWGEQREAYVTECERVPSIWRYTDDGLSATWEESWRGDPAADPGGYVGALAWVDADTALAVGGTGTFARREPQTPVDDPAYEDPAGEARAWLYERGSWSEITDSLPPGMGGLTALGCSTREPGLCVAGGLGELWAFRQGRFEVQPIQVSGAQSFRFRVRHILFAPGPKPGPRGVAVTSGCCASDPSQDKPTVLTYDGKGWQAGELQPTSGGGVFQQATGAPAGPYSAYAVSITDIKQGCKVSSVLLSPGGWPGAEGAELPSRIVRNAVPGTGGTGDCEGGVPPVPFHLLPRADGVRLVSGDGDQTGPPYRAPGEVATNAIGTTSDPTSPDGLMDWAVGFLRSSGRGVAYTTTRRAPLSPLRCPKPTPGITCQAGDPTEAATSRSLVALPSYALNAFRFVPDLAAGWAVGDHGAILRLGGAGTLGFASGEPEPPILGQRKPAPLADRSGYADQGANAQLEASPVPALSARPEEPLREPRFIAAGSPDTVRLSSQGPGGSIASYPLEAPSTIVMSRDGSEGWAIGPKRMTDNDPANAVATLYHYTEGAGWTRCDPEGIPGQLPPDPACESLVALRSYRAKVGDQARGRVALRAAARVPLEYDGDPTNDDEFEVVAFGSAYAERAGEPERAVVLRYGDGRWSLDRDAMRQLDLGGTEYPAAAAFSAPDDGWLVSKGTAGAGGNLYRYTAGAGWTKCTAASASACADPDGRLPPAGAIAGVATVGERTYLYGTRRTGTGLIASVISSSPEEAAYPLIIYRDRGPCGRAGDPGCWRADRSDGGYDPLGDDPSAGPSEQGIVSSLAVTQDPQGRLIGWAIGRFGPTQGHLENAGALNTSNTTFPPAPAMLRLGPTPGGSASVWSKWKADDAARDYGGMFIRNRPNNAREWHAVALPNGRAFVMPTNSPGSILLPPGPTLAFDPARERWETAPTPFTSVTRHQQPNVEARPVAIAADGEGGAWIAAKRIGGLVTAASTWFYRWTDRAPAPVFEEVVHPPPLQAGEKITSAAGGGDGSLWLATSLGELVRYDRITGWERVRIPGWDHARSTTRSPAHAVALGPDGRGVVVGAGGRIADVGSDGVMLDPAAGLPCDPSSPQAPCGTARDLSAAAVAPDGSALVGGASNTLLWRPAGAEFRAIPRPPGPADASITGISMPTPEHAWVSTTKGQVLAGKLAGGAWRWQVENLDQSGDLLAANQPDLGLKPGEPYLPLNAIAVDSSGRGLAVGEGGLVLERTGDGERPWRRLAAPQRSSFHSVALSPQGLADGALVGGSNGLILTWVAGRLEVARPGDPYDGLSVSGHDRKPATVAGVALLAGPELGQTEAWAALQEHSWGGFTTRTSLEWSVLHYASDPSEPLLNPTARARSLPDAPSPRAGEVSFAAFGKQECRPITVPNWRESICPEYTGSNRFNEVVARRVAEEIVARSHQPGGPMAALFTGDADEAAGRDWRPESTQGRSRRLRLSRAPTTAAG